MACRVSLSWPDYLRRTLVVDGVPHKLTPKLIELALLLIVRRGCFVPIPDVIEFLWPDPDDEPDFSEDVIRTYVSRLRKVLPPGAVVARSTTCTDRMEAGHYLPGALMLETEEAVARWFMDNELPDVLRPELPTRRYVRHVPDPRQLEFSFRAAKKPRKPLGKALPARRRVKAYTAPAHVFRAQAPFAMTAD